MPPELVALGDQLEQAAARVLARRRTRRQLVLNAAASLVIAVPLTVSVVTRTSTTAPVLPVPTTDALVTTLDDDPRVGEDYLPRDLRRMRLTPQSELLLLPSSQRRALR